MPAVGDTYLFDLINSLTKQEKIELHKYAFAGKADNIYFKVYKLIEGNEEYDETVLIKKAGIKKERLPEIKNYLHKTILKTLEIIHGNNISAIRNFQEISQILVLGYKGLFDQSLKRTNAALKKAIEKEDYINALTLIENRDEINFRFLGNFQSSADLNSAFEDYAETLKQAYELAHYKYLFFKSLLPVTVFEKESFDLTFSDKISDFKISSPQKPDTFQKKILLLRAQCRIAILEKDFKKAQKISARAINYMNVDPRKSAHLSAYLGYGFLNVHAGSCLFTGDYESGFATLKKIEEYLKEHGTSYENNIDYLFFNVNQMSLYSVSGNFEKTIETGLAYYKKYSKQIEQFIENSNIYNYNMGYSYFCLDDPKKSLKHLYAIINQSNDKRLRIDFFMKALFIEILIFLLKKDIDIAENKIRTYERLLKTNNRYDDYEKITCAFLKACLNNDMNKTFLKEQRALLYSKIKNLSDLNYHNRYFNLLNWLDSKTK